MINSSGRRAFTIVELLIVIVVIGILAALVISTYSGVQDRARTAALQNDASQAAQQIELLKVDNNDQYPSSIPAGTLKASSGDTYDYRKVNNDYCLTVSNTQVGSYFTASNGVTGVGPCPIGYWKLDGDAKDSSVYGDDGTVIGASLTTDRKGRTSSAYQVGDSAMYINMGSPAVLTNMPTGGISYSIWIMRSAASPTHWPSVMGDSNTHVGYGIRSNNYGDVIYLETGTTPYDGSSWGGVYNVPLPTNQWHMVTVTYQGGVVKLYGDGDYKNSGNLQLKSINGAISLGSSSAGFVGNIDDARIYDRALTGKEVKQLYQAE